MRFNKAKWKVLHLDQGNPKHKSRLGGEWVESSPEKGLGALVGERLRMNWQCARAIKKKKASRIAGCIKRSVATRLIRGLSPEDRLGELFSLEKRRLWADLIAAFQYQKGASKKAAQGLFLRGCSDRTRTSGFKLKRSRFGVDIGLLGSTRSKSLNVKATSLQLCISRLYLILQAFGKFSL